MGADQPVTYRKTRTSEWVVYGPHTVLTSAMEAGGIVQVTKKDDTTKDEVIERVGKPFEVDGAAMAYGYIKPPACDNCAKPGGVHRRRDSSGIQGLVCDRCSFEPHYALSFA